MNKHHRAQRSSAPPDTTSMDYKPREHIEEVRSLTEQILHGFHDMNYKYDYKLYRKYKQLKEINKELQKKIINQHCTGCKCHIQTDEDSIQMVNNSLNDSKNRIECSADDDEGQMDINENITTTTNDNNIEEEVDGLAGLPSDLQRIIQDIAIHGNKSKRHLLKVGLYPNISKYLCALNGNFKAKPSETFLRPFIMEQIKPQSEAYTKTISRVANQLLDIHQSYMLKCNIKRPIRNSTKK